jgi:hypothetical protein
MKKTAYLAIAALLSAGITAAVTGCNKSEQATEKQLKASFENKKDFDWNSMPPEARKGMEAALRGNSNPASARAASQGSSPTPSAPK